MMALARSHPMRALRFHFQCATSGPSAEFNAELATTREAGDLQ